MTEICKNCGKEVTVMCQQKTGFCCAYCEDQYELARFEAEGGRLPDEETE